MLMLILTSVAVAQDADTFDFSGSGFDNQSSLQLLHPRIGLANAWHVGAGIVYADDPLVRVYDDGREEEVVSSQFSTRLHGGYVIGQALRLDVAVPLYPNVVVDGEGGFYLGDVTIAAAIPIVMDDSDASDSVGFAIKPILRLPTGNEAGYVTQGGISGGLVAAVGGHSNQLLWRLNVGIDLGKKDTLEDLEFGSSFDAGAGLAYQIDASTHVGAELTSQVTLTGEKVWNKNPVEGHLYAGYLFPAGFNARIGVGTGLVAGVGAPDWRVAAALSYRDPGAPDDTDEDGILDEVDNCVNDPEDIDNFEDRDGCPDTDNDEDGILDVSDECPVDAEDPDGWEDEDGCPELDNDKDGIPDGGDDCPNEAGTASTNGCPDRDGDSIVDAEDACPEQPGPRETKGCPDRDGDRVPDNRDKCPDEPIQSNADPERSDGCPSRVVVTKDKIEILDIVYFNTAKATIKPVSYSLLDEVADVLNNNPDIALIEVAGHTDSDGSEAANLKLSQARAESVRTYLINKGVDGDRLVAKGYGEAEPIDTNKTSAGKANNRRVEFVIVDE